MIVVLGAVWTWGVVTDTRLHAVNLDGERNIPAAFAALLLVTASALALWAARGRALGRRGLWLLLAAGFALLAADEWFEVHERLERASAVDWQLLYAPLALLGATALVTMLRALAAIPAGRALVVLGVAAWGVSQVLEELQWNGDQRSENYRSMMSLEEMLEMTGSALFVLALYLVVMPASERGENSAEVDAPLTPAPTGRA